MSTHFHAVVWIDHHQARIFHFNASEVDSLVIQPDHRAPHLHHKAQAIGSGNTPEDQAFLHRVAAAIFDAGAILITGPADEKAELMKHIRRCDPALVQKIVAVQTSDHPSDGELVAQARRHFKVDHMMPPRMRRN
jgi:stalled ribosome rescue protein Dom34